MAADTAPAAVPGADDARGTTPQDGPQARLFASVLAPVEPARMAFNLDPEQAASQAMDLPDEGVSSAAFHDDGTSGDGTGSDSGSGSAGAQQKSVFRAWLLAGATRWAKGGGHTVKRLDLAKAKAQARQVKETRQVAVNNSGGLLGGKSGAAGSGVKPSGGKGNSDGGVKGPKNSTNNGGSASKGPVGSSGGRGPGGGAAGNGGARNGAGGKGGRDESTGRQQKQPKVDLKKDRGSKDQASGGKSNGAAGAAGGKTGPSGSSGSAGKNGAGATNGKGAGDGSGKGTSGGSSASGSKAGKDGTGKDLGGKSPAGTDAKGASDKAAKEPKNTKDTKATKDQASTAGAGKTSLVKGGQAGKDGKTPTGTAAGKDTKPKPAEGATGKDSKDAEKDSASTKPGQQTQPAPTGKTFWTRESRETGYRDGTRAGKAVAHVQAYRDGAKDGYSDVLTAAGREKTQLDKAHQERQNQQAKEQPVDGTRTSADYHQPPTPIEVKGIDANRVFLGDGAAKSSMSRGEVRSLKSFERRLTERATRMQKIAEDTKSLQAHAETQAKAALTKYEQARAVKGGDKLAASLLRLSEAAKNQAIQAEDIRKRAVRTAEAAQAVLANVQTRYSAMYQAVVDSDLTAPAELVFYKG